VLDERTLSETLTAMGVTYQLVAVRGTSRTAADAAAALGVPLRLIVKSLVCLAQDGTGLLALVPGDRELSLRRLARAASASSVRLASASAVAGLTGYTVGAVPPLGHLQPLPTFAEAALSDEAALYCGGGSERHMLRVSPDDLQRAAGLTWVGLCRDAPSRPGG